MHPHFNLVSFWKIRLIIQETNIPLLQVMGLPAIEANHGSRRMRFSSISTKFQLSHFKIIKMKKSFLMALACVITLASFANHGIRKGKHVKKQTTSVCPKDCPRSKCPYMK
jgi:hypothetical protein